MPEQLQGTPTPCQVVEVNGSLALPERDPQVLTYDPRAAARVDSPGGRSHPAIAGVEPGSPGPADRHPAETGSRSASARRRIPVANEEARLRTWRPLALHIARGYFFVGADDEDVRQEAMIGLLFGLREYEGQGEPSAAFIGLVVTRWLQTQVRHANRLKHGPLSNSRREDSHFEGEIFRLEFPDIAADPALIVEAREELRTMLDSFIEMSEFERESLVSTINGIPYRGNKPVDNAIQRARKKLRAA